MMKRVRNKTVTSLPVLLPCSHQEQDGLATFLMEFCSPQPVRVISDADLDVTSGSREEALAAMESFELREFKALVELITALQHKDKLTVALARKHAREALTFKREHDKQKGLVPASENDLPFGRKLIPLFGLSPGQERKAIARWNLYERGPMAESDEHWLLSQLVSEALDSVRLVLWWSGEQFEPALYCPDLKAALHTFLLMKVTAGKGWGVCLKCGEFFTKKRPDQMYCSIAHREAHRVARWRAAKISKSQQRGARKNVTRKAR